jgi:hypothetical protein
MLRGPAEAIDGRSRSVGAEADMVVQEVTAAIEGIMTVGVILAAAAAAAATEVARRSAGEDGNMIVETTTAAGTVTTATKTVGGERDDASCAGCAGVA